eukprot:scaffold238231_cov20-Tisochrysis_lutea.AAC.1
MRWPNHTPAIKNALRTYCFVEGLEEPEVALAFHLQKAISEGAIETCKVHFNVTNNVCGARAALKNMS